MPFAQGGYHFSAYALPNFTVAFLILSLAAWVRYFEGPTYIGSFFIGIGMAAAVWLGGFGVAYTANSALIAQHWIKVTLFGVLALPPIVHGLLGQLLLLEDRKRQINVYLWLISLVFAILLITNTDYLRSPYLYWWGYYADFGFVGRLSSLYLVAIFAWVAYEGIKVYRTLQPGSIRWKRVRLVLTGFSIAFIGVIDFLPAWGVPCYPFGYAMVMVMIGSVGYATWRYRLITITPETAAQQILTNLSDGVGVVDEAGYVALVNGQAEKLLGLEKTEILGQPVVALAERLGITKQVGNDLLLNPDGTTHEVRLAKPGGTEHIVGLTGRPLLNRHGERLFEVWVLHDITDYRRSVEEIEHLAYYDHRTALPNRTLLIKRIRQAAQPLQSGGRKSVALLLVGLNQFTYINETLGRSVGDGVLKIVAKRLQAALESGDTLAHIGADEFAILISSHATRLSVLQLVNRLEASLSEEILWHGKVLTVHASVGATFSREAGQDPEMLLREADTAMHQAKRGSPQAPVFYDTAMQKMLQKRLEVKHGLEQAINRNELVVHYQPQVNIETLQIVGFEALVRWQHPKEGLLGPAAFIDIAEETGILARLDSWVMRAATDQLSTWYNQLPHDYRPRLSVNLSPSKLRRGGFLKELKTILESTQMPASLLTVEITESTLMGDTDSVMAELRALRDLGVELAVDDFGTGYSSLSYLKRFPITEVKIDKGFVKDVGREDSDTAIVRAVIALGHALGLKTVAEGIESEEQLKQLNDMGCQVAQGFLFGRALPPDQAWEILKMDLNLSQLWSKNDP